MGQQSLIVVVRLTAKSIVPVVGYIHILCVHQLTVLHTSLEDVVTHKHVHHVVGISVVVTCRDRVASLVGIVVPLVGIAIPLDALFFQAGKVINATLGKCSIVLCKDGEFHLTLLRNVEGALVRVTGTRSLVVQMIASGRAIGIELLVLHQQAIQSALYQCLVEDGKFRISFQHLGQALCGARYHLVDNVYIAVGHLMVIGDHFCLVVESYHTVIIQFRDKGRIEHGADLLTARIAQLFNVRVHHGRQVIACNLLALLFRQAVDAILCQSVVRDACQRVIIQAVDILIHATVERGIAGILSVSVHHTVVARTLHDDIELMKERIVLFQEILYGLSGKGIQVGVIGFPAARCQCYCCSEQYSYGYFHDILVHNILQLVYYYWHMISSSVLCRRRYTRGSAPMHCSPPSRFR